jgi:hypothetical protein
MDAEQSAQLTEAAIAQVVNPRLTDAEQPFCALNHAHQWTSQHPSAPGQWVCSVSGKPGEQAWRSGQTAVTPEPPLYGAPAPVESFSPETLAAFKPAATQPPPEPTLLDLIAAAPTQADVLSMRQHYLQTGAWTPEHDAAGMARYQALAGRT